MIRHRKKSGGNRRPDRFWWWPLPIVALTCALVLGVHTSEGGLTANIINTGDAVQSGSLITAASSGGVTECDLSTGAFTPITATGNSATCTGTLAPSGTLASTGAAATSTTLTEMGSLTGSTGVTEGSCGAVQLANAAQAPDPMLVRGSPMSFAQPGPLSGSFGLGLSGVSGYAADIAGASGPATTSFTELVWFKATQAGSLIGFTNTSSNYRPGEWDKMLWLDNAGHVVFGVYPGRVVELTSAGTYLDGNWHLAVASVNTSSGMSLSVDAGTPVTNTTTSAQAYNGYWHVGWDNARAGWTDAPSNGYFSGTLADAAIFPSALSGTQISALYGASSQTAWAAQVSADGASDSWSLGDAGTSVYTGRIPGVGPAACSFADATIGVSAATTTCAAPASSSACPAPSSAVTLATLAGTTTPLAPSLAPGQGSTVTLTLARDPSTTVAAYPYATGLHLSATFAAVATAGGFTATLSWPSESIIL